MKKRIVLTVMLALLAGLLFSNVTLAQAPQPEKLRNSGRRSLGQVTAIDENQFTVTSRNGWSYQLLVDDNTRFQNAGESEAEFKDLTVGQWVIVIARPRQGEYSESQPRFIARLVVLLPQEIDLSQRFGIRTRGVVTATNLADGTFEVRDLNGQILILAVGENTRFLGQVTGLSDLQPGMNVAAAAQPASQGYPQAIIVAARFPLAKHAGKITAVDPENGRFSLETIRNGTLTFQVDAQTRFRGLNQSLQGLDDLQAGMLARVSARQEDGQLLALLVAAANRSDLPIFQSDQPNP